MNYPSIKTISNAFPHADAKAIRHAMENHLGGAINRLLEGHGWEYVYHATETGQFGEPEMVFKYVNTGDTYNATVVSYNGRYRVTTMGGMIEALGRRGVQCL
jgi:hypothetical protein